MDTSFNGSYKLLTLRIVRDEQPFADKAAGEGRICNEGGIWQWHPKQLNLQFIYLLFQQHNQQCIN